MQLSYAEVIALSIVADQPITFAYTDADGVVSVRHFKPRALRRCYNGGTVVEGWDLDREAFRQFCIGRMEAITPGDRAAAVVVL